MKRFEIKAYIELVITCVVVGTVRSDSKEDIIKECVDEIEHGNYTAALITLKSIAKEDVHFIVSEFDPQYYRNKYDQMFVFTHLVDDMEKKCSLYEELTDHVSTMDDDCQVLKLMRLIEKELISCRDCPFDIIARAHPLVINLTAHYAMIINDKLHIDGYNITTQVLRVPDIFNVTIGDVHYLVTYSLELSIKSGYNCRRFMLRNTNKHDYSKLHKVYRKP